MPKRLKVTMMKSHAMQVTRVSIGKKKLVYVILAQNPLRYQWGRSKIAYIGTTKRGVSRIAQSVAARANDVLNIRGVKEFHVKVITCIPRKNVATWVKLERALIFLFRQRFGALPKCNTKGKNMKLKDEFSYFNKTRLERLIEDIT